MNSDYTDRLAPDEDQPIETRPTCDVCGQPVTGESQDIWALTTYYDKNGEVRKTGEQADLDVFENDYLVICDQFKCQKWLHKLWYDFVTSLKKDTLGK